MQYTTYYDSPLGGILLAADELGLTGLWFDAAKYYGSGLEVGCRPGSLSSLEEAVRWLDIYFGGREPDFTPTLHLSGTEFQKSVWDELLKIPYGKTASYGEIAKRLAQKLAVSRMSAQAVGGAVGRNKISIIVPCHRVVGSSGSLTGYAGGVDKKAALLLLEGADVRGLQSRESEK